MIYSVEKSKNPEMFEPSSPLNEMPTIDGRVFRPLIL